MTGRIVSGLVAGLLLATSSTRALGEAALDEATAAYDRGELDRAGELFRAALERPGNEPEALITIHRHLGILAAATGDLAGARAAFEVLLALDPDQEPPSELGGAQRGPFDEARAARGGRPLRLEVRLPVAARPTGAEISVAALDAPAGLVDAMRVTVRSGAASPGWSLRLDGAGPQVLAVPGSALGASGPTTVRVEALDAHGGVLGRTEEPLLASSAGEAAPPTGAGASTAATEAAPRVGRRADLDWLWITLGVVGGLLVAGAVTAVAIVYSSEHVYVIGSPVAR